ncbi:hypothetical protein VV02_10620 [Luteipulveratus mongoliensis]|uniref:AB hydrolase-1 domain-containing protein n=2 Tax=Luteipulveratus mongoliensis TaxID=571913 RepID=A0A0K1JQF4_9MICO|nr:hypothetical protein VV02_10620 [Luteipulveratus mongoliensis]
MRLTPMPDGHRLATWTTGSPGAHPPVVLVHGGPGLWDYLAPLAALIDDLTLVHRYDQRGCGRSDIGGPYSMSQYVADLDALRAAAGYDRWTVIGHSFGATLALAYASGHPSHTAGLGYVSGVGIGDWQTPFMRERARRGRPFAARLGDLEERTVRTAAEETEWRQLHWATDYADATQGIELARPMAEVDLAINTRANKALTFTDEDCVAWAASVTCPVTFIHGTEDPRPLDNARQLADATRGAQLRPVRRAGHLPWIEQPDEVAAPLRTLVTATHDG